MYATILPEWVHYPKWNQFNGIPYTGKKKKAFSEMFDKPRLEQGSLFKAVNPQFLGQYAYKKRRMTGVVGIPLGPSPTKGSVRKSKLKKLKQLEILHTKESRGTRPRYESNVNQMADFSELGLVRKFSSMKTSGGRTHYGMLKHKLGVINHSAAPSVEPYHRPVLKPYRYGYLK